MAKSKRKPARKASAKSALRKKTAKAAHSREVPVRQARAKQESGQSRA